MKNMLPNIETITVRLSKQQAETGLTYDVIFNHHKTTGSDCIIQAIDDGEFWFEHKPDAEDFLGSLTEDEVEFYTDKTLDAINLIQNTYRDTGKYVGVTISAREA